MRLIGEDQNIEFYMRSGHRSYSSYLESVYFGWWVVCIHAHVLGLRDLLYCTPVEATNLIVIVLSYGNVMMK